MLPQGWGILANHVLRVHLPLIVPTINGTECCALVCEKQPQYHKVGDFVVFDDSKMHYAFNGHKTVELSCFHLVPLRVGCLLACC